MRFRVRWGRETLAVSVADDATLGDLRAAVREQLATSSTARMWLIKMVRPQQLHSLGLLLTHSPCDVYCFAVADADPSKRIELSLNKVDEVAGENDEKLQEVCTLLESLHLLICIAPNVDAFDSTKSDVRWPCMVTN